MEHRFNLASDPWIPVYNKNLDQKLVSLRDLLAHSDIYRIDLSDIALMRFIAAAHWTVRYREGAGLPIGKRLPAAWVDDYLDRHTTTPTVTLTTSTTATTAATMRAALPCFVFFFPSEGLGTGAGSWVALPSMLLFTVVIFGYPCLPLRRPSSHMALTHAG